MLKINGKVLSGLKEGFKFTGKVILAGFTYEAMKNVFIIGQDLYYDSIDGMNYVMTLPGKLIKKFKNKKNEKAE